MWAMLWQKKLYTFLSWIIPSNTPSSCGIYRSIKIHFNISQRQIVDSSKLKEFADDNFKFDENG